MGSFPGVSVVIPTLNAESELSGLLRVLKRQTLCPEEIIVVDSSSDDLTGEIAEDDPSVTLIRIDRGDFNHGATRDMAFRRSSGDLVCFLTQDAVPVSDAYLERLVAPLLSDDGIALVSGRQLPKPDARRFEQLVRAFNYPEESSVRSVTDLPRLGIKTFFASDVCSAYRRSAYLACGGFPRLETNEDMLMAARFIEAGYKVAYEASAEVYHSHNLTICQQFNRNRMVGRFLASHASELMGALEFGEGARLAKSVADILLREGNLLELLAFGADCAARLLGNRAGRLDAESDTRGNAGMV